MPPGKRLIAAAALLCVTANGALAQTLGQPHPWQLGLQEAVTPVMERIIHFHDFLLYIITAIAILLVIAVPSFKLLFFQLIPPPADLTIKATGKQWFWSYSYPDNGKFEFDSLMVKPEELKPGQPRLLAADNEMVVPVNKIVHLITTGADVIHAFAVPAFGVKIDAVPGRLNESWFEVTREGVYYGQCSELCGKDHAYMPIAVRAVSEKDFGAWVEGAKKKYARAPSDTISVAQTQAFEGIRQ
jgi:cytochrome c oxidase subunit 2